MEAHMVMGNEWTVSKALNHMWSGADTMEVFKNLTIALLSFYHKI